MLTQIEQTSIAATAYTLRVTQASANSNLTPVPLVTNPLQLWIDSVDGCKLTINGVITGVQGPWSWDWGDGSMTSGWFPQDHNYRRSGSYIVWVSAPNGITNSLPVEVDCAYENEVRYVLADSQLGEVISYYREHMEKATVVEAVARWDAGVRVTNISQFERKIVPDKGWQVVYAGTNSQIDGSDVSLTTDTNPVGEPEILPTNPLQLWIDSVDGCKVKINGVIIGVQGPWFWDWGDGSSSTGWFPQGHVFSSSGIYNISVSTSSGITNSLTVEVNCAPSNN